MYWGALALVGALMLGYFLVLAHRELKGLDAELRNHKWHPNASASGGGPGVSIGDLPG